MRAAGRDGVTSDMLGRAKQLGISPQRAAGFRASLPTVAETKAATPAVADVPAKPASTASPATFPNSPARRVVPADRGDSINAPMQPVPAGGKTSWRAMPPSSLVNPSGKAIPGILAPDQQSGKVKINRLTGKPFGWKPGDPEPAGEQMQAARTGAVPPMIAKAPEPAPTVAKAPAKPLQPADPRSEEALAAMANASGPDPAKVFAKPAAAPAAPMAVSKPASAAVAKPPGSAGATGQPGAKAAVPVSPLAAAWRQPIAPKAQPAANIAEAAGFRSPARKVAPVATKPPSYDGTSMISDEDARKRNFRRVSDVAAAGREAAKKIEAEKQAKTKQRLADIEANKTLPGWADPQSLAADAIKWVQRKTVR